MPKSASVPMQTSYRAELVATKELSVELAAYFQLLIGILRWTGELGRVDVCLECSILSPYLALPGESQLEQLLMIFSYLETHHNVELVFDPSYPEIDGEAFARRDWTTSEFGHVAGTEELPPKCTEASRCWTCRSN